MQYFACIHTDNTWVDVVLSAKVQSRPRQALNHLINQLPFAFLSGTHQGGQQTTPIGHRDQHGVGTGYKQSPNKNLACCGVVYGHMTTDCQL